MRGTIQNLENKLDPIDLRLTRWMARNSLDLLRISLGIVFIWFGSLKFFPGLSPAEQLVRNTITFFNPDIFVPILALWEVLIGVGFLSGLFTRKFQRLTILVLFAQMIGAWSPLVLLPEAVWTNFPLGLTLEGQYIFKNLVIIAGALVIGATNRGGGLVAEPIDSVQAKENIQ